VTAGVAASAAVLIAALPLAAGADTAAVAGVTLGVPIAGIATALGPPVDVASTDGGNRFAFAHVAAYTDGDGIVQAVDASAGTPRIDVDGTPHAFAIGSYALARADAELASDAEFARSDVRTYRVPPDRELVLVFADATQRLARVVYGERGAIVRLGLVPGENPATIAAYTAPRVRSTALAGDRGTDATVVRIAVDSRGNVQTVDVVIASHDVAFDAQLATRIRADRFVAATLGGRAIGRVVFREIRH